MKRILLTIITSFALLWNAVAQNIIYVDVSNANALIKNGINWATAFSDLQDGIDAAVAGDEVRVAMGTYYPTVVSGVDPGVSANTRNRFRTFLLKSNVKILGGYESGYSVRDYTNNPTILSGDLGTLGSVSDNAVNVVFIPDGVVNVELDGFTIQDGSANGGTQKRNIGGVNYDAFYGGGIFLSGATGSFKNLIITRNSATTGSSSNSNFGGGFYCNSNAGLVSLFNVIFDGNKTSTTNNANNYGGALYAGGTIKMDRIIFRNNSSTPAGGSSAAGGAIYLPNVGSSDVTVTNSVFYNNSASEGGAIHLKVGTSQTTTLKVINCTFYKNSATAAGGAIHSNSSANININVSNSIFLQNTAVSVNTNAVNNPNNAVFTINNCVTQDVPGSNVTVGPYVVTGFSASEVFDSIIDTDPNFLRLQTSVLPNPAINTGDDAFVSADITTDYLGNTRKINRVDLGAFEVQDAAIPNPPLPVTLKSFTAKSVNQGVKLNWATASELVNDYFQVLRKPGGSAEFTAVGQKIKGAGTTSNPQQYEFLDTKPLAGVNYYKLAQVDLDGKINYSDVVFAYGNFTKNSAKIAYANGKLTLDFETLKAGEAKLNVVDANGKVLYVTSANTNAGANTISRILNLPIGIYIVKLAVGGETTATKFVVR